MKDIFNNGIAQAIVIILFLALILLALVYGITEAEDRRDQTQWIRYQYCVERYGPERDFDCRHHFGVPVHQPIYEEWRLRYEHP